MIGHLAVAVQLRSAIAKRAVDCYLIGKHTRVANEKETCEKPWGNSLVP